MAGIDKTYIDGKDYLNYRQWWIDNYDKMIKERGEAIWLYTFCMYDEDVTPELLKTRDDDIKEYEGRYDFPVWNTTESWDKWLVKNCDIPSYRQRMLDVYDVNWSGFKGQEWVPKKKKKQKYIR